MAALHIDVKGSGAPLLLIHGWGMHGGIWGVVVERLAEHFRVLAVDLPGHGFSLPPSPAGGRGSGGEGVSGLNETLTLTLSRLRERGSSQEPALNAIVDELAAQFDEPLSLCGWSLGGQIALRWAQREPEKITRLALVASTPCFVRRSGWDCGMAEETLAEFAAELQQDYAATLRRFLALQVRGSDHERELLVMLRKALMSRGEPDPGALRAGLEILRDCDLRDALPDIKQPALVLCGQRDTLTPPQASHYLAAQLPNARLVEIKGAAHAPFLSHPEEFVMQLIQFMENKSD